VWGTRLPKLPLPAVDLDPRLNLYMVRCTPRVAIPNSNDIAIGPAVSAGLKVVTSRHTDGPRYVYVKTRVAIGRAYAMRSKH